jgi:hypothetical protein
MFVNKYLAFITISMAVMGESEWGTRRSVNDVLGIMMGALFLRSIRVHLTLLGQYEW